MKTHVMMIVLIIFVHVFPCFAKTDTVTRVDINVPASCVGDYGYDAEDDPALSIYAFKDGSSHVLLYLYRLYFIDDGVGVIKDGVLQVSAGSSIEEPIVYNVSFKGNNATVTVLESTWEYLPKGTKYEFIKISDTPTLRAD